MNGICTLEFILPFICAATCLHKTHTYKMIFIHEMMVKEIKKEEKESRQERKI